jgi:hypothetical protein
MAKVPMSVRVPENIATQLEAYSEAHDMNRTEALVRLLEYAVNQSPPPEPVEERERHRGLEDVYTARLEPQLSEWVVEYVEDNPESFDDPHEFIEMAVRRAKADMW